MDKILNITQKDLVQFARDPKTFLFLLGMPIIFTLMFGLAFGAFNKGEADNRLPVGLLNQDGGAVAGELATLLRTSSVIRIEEDTAATEASLLERVSKKELAGAIIIPPNYSNFDAPEKLTLITDPTTPVGMSLQSETQAAASKVANMSRIAKIVSDNTGKSAGTVFRDVGVAWNRQPVVVKETASALVEVKPTGNALNTSSPGNMLQFGIAGLLTVSTVMVTERKSRCLQRLLTTATSRLQILTGHFLAVFALIFGQFAILIAFGQVLLKVNYMGDPLATLLVAVASALCIAALGMLIGVLAKTDEQAIMFSLLAMFILSPIGGAWVPLEVTSPVFQAVGHLSPVAWAMDGFKNVVARGLGLQSVLLPAAALLGYAILFMALAVWRLNASEEK